MGFEYKWMEINEPWSNVNSVTITVPAWVQDWDIMFAVTQCYAYDQLPPAWRTKLYQGWGYLRWAYFYRIANNEPANYTFDWYRANRSSVRLYYFRWWFDINNPINIISTTWNGTWSSININKVNAPIVQMCHTYDWDYSTAPTTPSSFTMNYTYYSGTSPYTGWWISSVVWSSSWNTWNFNGTGTSSDVLSFCTVALNPAAAASTSNTTNFFQFIN